MLKGKKILIVDDDLFLHSELLGSLYAEGAEVISARTLAEGQSKFRESTGINLVILDIRLPVGDYTENLETEYERNAVKGGFESGLVLAQWIKRNHPDLPLVGFSVHDPSSSAAQWFSRYGAGYLQKSISSAVSIIDLIKDVLGVDKSEKRLKTFIVHGQDEKTKYELKNYLQNVLKLHEPIILHEQPSFGRSIIEKFEDVAKDIDVVFVLLTPDDVVYDTRTSNSIKRRARQNVIFEMGYFLSSLQRKKGRVLLLYKGELELPSDIAGLIYIDITSGIESAGEGIRRELADLLHF